MKNIFLVLFIIAISHSFSSAQDIDIVVEDVLIEDTVPSKWGQNQRHFGHLYGSFGFVIRGGDHYTSTDYGLSNRFGFGYRYKLKVNKRYAIGADLGLSFSNYRKKIEYYTYNLDMETSINKIRYKLLSLELYQRINFGKRKNKIDYYVDLGFYGGYLFSTKSIIKRKHLGGYYADVKTVTKDLDYILNYTYGISARIVINKWSAFAKYRVSNISHSQSFYPYEHIYSGNISNDFSKLPRLIIGVEYSLGIH